MIPDEIVATPPSAPTSPRKPARRTVAIAIFAATLALAACAARKPPPERTDGAYTGPAITLEQAAGEHVAVAATPTSGWTVTLDQAPEVHLGRELYLTLRQPHPAFILQKQPQQQRVGTGIAAGIAVSLYARVIPHDAIADGPYNLALPMTLPNTPANTPATRPKP